MALGFKLRVCMGSVLRDLRKLSNDHPSHFLLLIPVPISYPSLIFNYSMLEIVEKCI